MIPNTKPHLDLTGFENTDQYKWSSDKEFPPLDLKR